MFNLDLVLVVVSFVFAAGALFAYRKSKDVRGAQRTVPVALTVLILMWFACIAVGIVWLDWGQNVSMIALLCLLVISTGWPFLVVYTHNLPMAQYSLWSSQRTIRTMLSVTIVAVAAGVGSLWLGVLFFALIFADVFLGDRVTSRRSGVKGAARFGRTALHSVVDLVLLAGGASFFRSAMEAPQDERITSYLIAIFATVGIYAYIVWLMPTADSPPKIDKRTVGSS